jgi:trans-aconitate methyltransferase
MTAPGNQMPSLIEMCLTGNYKTDKFGRSHSYVENFYEQALAPMRDRVRQVLEIGIYEGGSIQLWRDYFAQAYITGMDVVVRTVPSERIQLVHQDAYTHHVASFFPDGYFDFMVDDGPHTLRSQLSFLDLYLGKLREGGLLVIEDIASMEAAKALVKHISNQTFTKVEIVDLTSIDTANPVKDSILLTVWR